MLMAFLFEQYWFIPPIGSLRIVGTAEIAGTIVYVLVFLTIIIFAEANLRIMAKLAISTEKLRQAGEDLERRVAERTWELQQSNTEPSRL